MAGPPASMGGPVGPPMAAPAPAPKKGNVAVLVVVGAAVLTGAGLGAYFLLKGGGGSPFPCDVKNLPDETAQVTMVAVDAQIAKASGVDEGDLPDQARWSEFASSFCAGRDVFATAMSADDKFGARALARIVDEKKEAAKYLECGKTVAGKAKGGYAWAVAFKEKKDRRRVTIFMNGLDELPGSTKQLKAAKDKGALVGAHCFLRDKEEECSDKSEGVARVDKTNMWVQGGIDDLVAFGNAYSDKGGNGGKTADALAEVAGKISAKHSMQVGTHESFPFELGYASGASVGNDGLDGEEKADLAKVSEKIRKAEPLWAMGGNVDDSGGKTELYIRAGSEADAKDLLELSEKWLKLTKKAVKATDEKEKERKDDESDKDLKKVKREYLKARKNVARRALVDATSEQKGQYVLVTLEYKPDADEKSALEEYKKDNKARVGPAAKIVDALLKGEKPEKDLLKELGGSDLVDAVEGGGADKDDDD